MERDFSRPSDGITSIGHEGNFFLIPAWHDELQPYSELRILSFKTDAAENLYSLNISVREEDVAQSCCQLSNVFRALIFHMSYTLDVCTDVSPIMIRPDFCDRVRSHQLGELSIRP
jgi:hypothetical protein